MLQLNDLNNIRLYARKHSSLSLRSKFLLDLIVDTVIVNAERLVISSSTTVYECIFTYIIITIIKF